MIIKQKHLILPEKYPRRINASVVAKPDTTKLCLSGFEDQVFIEGRFPNVELLCITNSDKNFVYYNLGKFEFPKVKTVILLSHPGDHIVQSRLEGVNVVSPYTHYFRYHKRHYPIENNEDLVNVMKNLGYL
jgi:hypothetical protein